jgi:tetratricopeptide (TPR) repeat protein
MDQHIENLCPDGSDFGPEDGEIIEIFDGDEPTPEPAFAADVAPEGGDVLALVVPTPTPRPEPPAPPAGEVERLVAAARDLFALGNFTGALELLERALALDPRHPEARDYFARTEETLVQMYESKLGHLSRTPRVLLQPDEIVWLNLDHRAGFVLAQIDGQVTLEDIFALSGMSRLDTAKILVELTEQGAIAS